MVPMRLTGSVTGNWIARALTNRPGARGHSRSHGELQMGLSKLSGARISENAKNHPAFRWSSFSCTIQRIDPHEARNVRDPSGALR